MEQTLHENRGIPKNFHFTIHKDKWDVVFPKTWDKKKTPVKGLVGKWSSLFTEKFTEINPYCSLCFTYNRIRKSTNKTKAPFYFCKAFCKHSGCASYDFKVRTEPGPDCQYVDVYVDRIGDLSHGPGPGIPTVVQGSFYPESTGEISYQSGQGLPRMVHEKENSLQMSVPRQAVQEKDLQSGHEVGYGGSSLVHEKDTQGNHVAEYGIPTVIQDKDRESFLTVSNESQQSLSEETGYYLVLNQAHSTLGHTNQDQIVESSEQHYIVSQDISGTSSNINKEINTAVNSIQISGVQSLGNHVTAEDTQQFMSHPSISSGGEGIDDVVVEMQKKIGSEFYIHVSRAEWDMIKPRGRKSYQLIKPWTKIFQEKLSWEIPDCEIIFKMNKIKKEGSRKIFAPYFNGRGVCRWKNCATYHFSIQSTPNDDDSSIDIFVQRKGNVSHGLLAFTEVSKGDPNGDGMQNNAECATQNDNNDQLNVSGSDRAQNNVVESKLASDEGFQTEFTLLLSHSNWLSVKPTSRRPMQLDRIWTEVFAKKFSQKNPHCTLLFKMNKIKKENTRKLKCPYFNGRAVCRKDGCATYSFHIQEKPVESEPVTVKVTRRGQISHNLQDIPEHSGTAVQEESSGKCVEVTSSHDDNMTTTAETDDDKGGNSSDSDTDATIDMTSTTLSHHSDTYKVESQSNSDQSSFDAKSHVDFASKLGLTTSKSSNTAPRLKIYVVKSENIETNTSDVNPQESEQDDKKNLLACHTKPGRSKWLPQRADESFALYINRDEWTNIKPRIFKPHQLSRNWTDVLRSKFEQKDTCCLLKFVSNFVKISTSRKSGCSYFRARALCKYIGCAKYVFRIHNEPTENDKLILLSVERFGKIHHKQQPSVSADEKRKIKVELNSYGYAKEEMNNSDSENEGIEEPEAHLPRPSNNTSMSQDSETNERRRYKLAKRSIDFSSLKSSEKYVFTLTREEWDLIKPKASNDSTQGHLCEKWTELFGHKVSSWNPHCTLSFYYNRVKGKASRKINCQYFCAKAYCKFTGCASFLFRISRPPTEDDTSIRVVVKRYGQIRHSSINNTDSSNDIVLSENQVFNIQLSHLEWDTIKPIKTSNRSLIGSWSKLFHSKFSQVNPYCLLTFKTNRVKAKDSKKKNAIFFRSNAHCKIPGCVKYLFSIDEEPTENDSIISVQVKRLGAIHHINGIVNSQNVMTDQNPYFEIQLNNAEWRKIMPNANATKGKRFLSGKWSEVLIAKFFQQNPYCVLSFKRCSIRGRHNTKATLYMHAKATCKFPGCAMYEFFIQNEPVEWEECVKIQVQRNGNIHHGSGDTKDVYRNRKALMAISGKFVSKPRRPTMRKRKSMQNGTIVTRDETSLAVANALATFQSEYALPYSVTSYSINNQMFLTNQHSVNSNEQRNDSTQNMAMCTEAFNTVSASTDEVQTSTNTQYIYPVPEHDLPKVDKEFQITLIRAEFEKIRPSPTHPQFTGEWTSLFLKKLKERGVPCFVAFNYNKVKKLGSRREHAPYFRGRGTCKYQNCCSYLFLIQDVPSSGNREVTITVNRQGEINHTADMMDEHLSNERKSRRPNKRKLEISEQQTVETNETRYVNQEKLSSANDFLNRNSALPTVTVPNNYIITDSYVDNIVFSANNVQMVTNDNNTVYIASTDVIQPTVDNHSMHHVPNITEPSHNVSNIQTAVPNVTSLIGPLPNACNVVHNISSLTGNSYSIPNLSDTVHGIGIPAHSSSTITPVYNVPTNTTSIHNQSQIIIPHHNITDKNTTSMVSDITDSSTSANIPHTAHIISQFTEPMQGLSDTSISTVSETLHSQSYSLQSVLSNSCVNSVSKMSKALASISYSEPIQSLSNTPITSVSKISEAQSRLSYTEPSCFSNVLNTTVSETPETLPSISSFSNSSQSTSDTSVNTASKMPETLHNTSYLTDENISNITPPVMHNASNIAVPVDDVTNITAPVHDESTVLTPLNTVKEITPQRIPSLNDEKTFDAEVNNTQDSLPGTKNGSSVSKDMYVYDTNDTSSFTLVDKDNVVIGSVECVPLVSNETEQDDGPCVSAETIQAIEDQEQDETESGKTCETTKYQIPCFDLEIVSIFEEEYDAAFTIILDQQEWNSIKPTGEIKSLIGKWSKLFQAKLTELGYFCVLSFHYNRVKSKESRKYKCPYFRGKARCRTYGCCRYKFVIQKEPVASDREHIVILVARFGTLVH